MVNPIHLFTSAGPFYALSNEQEIRASECYLHFHFADRKVKFAVSAIFGFDCSFKWRIRDYRTNKQKTHFLEGYNTGSKHRCLSFDRLFR